MKGLGLLQQRFQPIAVDVQGLEGVHRADQVCHHMLYSVPVGHVDQPHVSPTTDFDSVQFVGINIGDFRHHFALGSDRAFRGQPENNTATRTTGKCSFETVPTFALCSCVLKIPGLSGQNSTPFEISFTPNTKVASAINAKPISTQIAKAFIRSTSNLGGGR
jgi:hypothetical protein